MSEVVARSVAVSKVEEDRERSAELWTAYTLRVGVYTSAILIAVGYVLLLLHPGPLTEVPHSLVEISGLAYSANPIGVASLGLFILIATAFVRVFVAAVLFARDRDQAFFLISASVFAILVASLWLGKTD